MRMSGQIISYWYEKIDDHTLQQINEIKADKHYINRGSNDSDDESNDESNDESDDESDDEYRYFADEYRSRLRRY